MVKKDIIKTYQDYENKIGNRKSLYRSVIKKYDIQSILYPGSHIDIAPSFLISNVIYVDNFKGAIRFFKDIEVIKEYINEHKEYDEPCEMRFINEDYTNPLDIAPVDLIISQYAGFVGQATKKYLKSGGILLCNDSHADATLARFDQDYELVGIIDNSGHINRSNLGQYFKLAKDKTVDLEKVRQEMKGPKYTHKAQNYLFSKI